MPRYQISYKVNSKTQTSEITADNYSIVRDFFNALFVGELLEIREVLHEDDTIIKDDVLYSNYANVKLYSLNRVSFNSFKVPKLKKTIDSIILKSLVETNIKINGLRPYLVNITVNYKT